MQSSATRTSFGALLRQFRLAAHLSQEALAERAAMSSDGIGALERGVNKAPQRETLALIVNALQLKPEQRQALEAAAQRPSSPRRATSRAARKHNLPRPGSSLYGREHDVAGIQALLADTPQLTLTGAGGVGKTRLAIELGLRALDDIEDGAWFVDLAVVRDPDAVASAIADAFGIRENRALPLIDAITEALGRKKMLLILDNCEHVITAVAATVEKIIARCPGVRVLATSRQPLAIPEERTYRLASLGLGAAVALFTDTAQRADPSFSVDGEVAAVERICRRLDGIALAIKLAAARVRLLSVTQIEELLAQRFDMLTGGGSLPRHQTMRALVDWSYDLLSDEERLLFERLGVFPADFSFEAASKICDGDGIADSRILDILASLVDKSLLTSERRGKARRFRLLETMRAYAREKLDNSIDTLNRRHAQYYLKLVESGDSRAPEWHDALEVDYDNLRSALDWAIDENGDVPLGIRLLAGMREFLLYRGLNADAARRVERALDGRVLLPKPLQAMAWQTIAAMRGDLLMPAEAFEASSRALELFEELHDFTGMARALRGRGVANLRLGKFAEADADLRLSLELSKKYDDARNVARTLGSIAVSLEMTGRPEEGHKVMLDVLEIARHSDDERVVGVTLVNLAEAEFAIGDSKSAEGRLNELLASRAARHNPRLRANTESNLAVYLLAQHREDEARAMARAAVFDAREAGDVGIVACAIQHLAAILVATDAHTAAKLLGYVESVFAAGYRRENTERYSHALLTTALHGALTDADLAALAREGAAMSELQAARIATRMHKTLQLS